MKGYWLNSKGIHLYAESDLFAKRSKLPIELLCLSRRLQQEMNSKDQLFFQGIRAYMLEFGVNPYLPY